MKLTTEDPKQKNADLRVFDYKKEDESVVKKEHSNLRLRKIKYDTKYVITLPNHNNDNNV